MPWRTGPANDHSSGTDDYVDLGVDGRFQWRKSKAHVFSAYATAIRETARLHSSFATAASGSDRFSLYTYKVNGSYYYDQTWGFTTGLFAVHGSSDAVIDAAARDVGSLTNSPNTKGYFVQRDWTPFGKEDSLWTPWVNLRLALQYTGYTSFNGKSTNYDGNGRNASDNNTLYLLGWIAF